jgi:hypothetical protein
MNHIIGETWNATTGSPNFNISNMVAVSRRKQKTTLTTLLRLTQAEGPSTITWTHLKQQFVGLDEFLVIIRESVQGELPDTCPLWIYEQT